METNKLPKKADPPEPDFANLPGLAEMFKSVLPRQIPQIEYQPGIAPLIGNFFHNWQLRQIERETERLANIAENNCLLVKAQIETFLQFVTISEEHQTYLMRIRHERRIMEIDEEKGQAEVDKVRMANLISKAEYDRIMAEVKAITYQMDKKNAVETENGEE